MCRLVFRLVSRHHRSRILPLLSALAILVLTLGCSRQRADQDRANAPADAEQLGAPAAFAESKLSRDALGAAALAPLAPPQGNAVPSAPTGQPRGTSASMIIRTGNASVEVDSLEPAIAAVQRLALALGGWVGNTSLASGEYQVRNATLELKIPSQRYDDALRGLSPVGTVETITSDAQDVGEEFVDLSARVRNARRLETRLVALLDTRTGKLEDVLAVERELARVREDIERLEGRLRYLETRVATSTLLVTLHERAPLVSASPGQNVLGEAFRDAWRNFVHLLAGAIAALGILVPVGVVVTVIVMAWRRSRRGRGPAASNA
ncbi:MAG: DUF4349 domain-containing protein [Gemmatimonadaceae bacterium]